MKIIVIAFTDKRGGAAKAAVRIRTLFNNNDVNSNFISIESSENKIPLLNKIQHFIFWVISHFFTKFQRSSNPCKYSLNLFGSNYIKNRIINSKLLHLHWINNETLNISNFPLLSGKSVITLHDEWFYCGAEHHAIDDEHYDRVVNGYTIENKNVYGIDLNRLVWERKRKYYSHLNNVIFTVPSTWMKCRAEQSYLLRNKDIRVVPNPIDTTIFSPDNSQFTLDGISPEDFVITFGAIDGGSSNIKGFDLLVEAIRYFSKQVDSRENIKIIIFGGKEKKYGSMFGIKTIELGHISSEPKLAKIYSISSITVVPSRVESFGQVAAESLSCETPVVAFNYSGLTDIVKHKINGYLAEPFKALSLAEGILWCYHLDKDQKTQVGVQGRERVVQFFSNDVIRNKLLAIYKELDNKQN
ncbi:glycosyltransferase [Photobacterium phosphoreum]|uniref:glycosyltransferase n=1 Tax=Photobacterium phosphoreum TaxID=659 RepID=UPI001E2AA3C0|nr:glycosyltransferase [Photobacterium phosphoreum]MCD9477845.1 glycosyltransferase [Photobacterium phosphoreum]